jgi:hypothetical protein
MLDRRACAYSMPFFHLIQFQDLGDGDGQIESL